MAGTKSNLERVEAFAERIDRTLREREADRRSLHNVKKSKVHVILEQCGYKKRSSGNLAMIEEVLRCRGVYAHPKITDPELPRDALITFNRVPNDERDFRLVFKTEKAFQDFIVQNFNLLPAFNKLRLVAEEYRLPSGRRVDLYCRHIHTRDHVLIELKRDAPDQRLLYQILSYMDEFRPQAGQYEVQGLLVTGRPEPTIQRTLASLNGDGSIGWLCYRAELQLNSVDLGSSTKSA